MNWWDEFVTEESSSGNWWDDFVTEDTPAAQPSRTEAAVAKPEVTTERPSWQMDYPTSVNPDDVHVEMPGQRVKELAAAYPAAREQFIRQFGEQIRGANLPEEELQAKFSEALKGFEKEYTDQMGPVRGKEFLKLVGQQIGDTALYHFPASIAGALEGVDIFKEDDWKDDLRRRSRAQTESRATGLPERDTAFPLASSRDLESLGHSLGFSGTSMLAGLAAGLPASAAGPVAGFAAGGAASGVAAYRQAAGDFMYRVYEAANEEYRKTHDHDLPYEEFRSKAKEFESLARESGLWEAIPEALGNMAGFGILASPLRSQMNKVFGKNIATRFFTKAAGVYGTELATETVTEHGQHNVEVKAGLTNEPMRSFTSGEDWKQSFDDIAGITLLQTTLLASGTKAGMMLKDKIERGSLTKQQYDALRELNDTIDHSVSDPVRLDALVRSILDPNQYADPGVDLSAPQDGLLASPIVGRTGGVGEEPDDKPQAFKVERNRILSDLESIAESGVVTGETESRKQVLRARLAEIEQAEAPASSALREQAEKVSAERAALGMDPGTPWTGTAESLAATEKALRDIPPLEPIAPPAGILGPVAPQPFAPQTGIDGAPATPPPSQGIPPSGVSPVTPPPSWGIPHFGGYPAAQTTAAPAAPVGLSRGPALPYDTYVWDAANNTYTKQVTSGTADVINIADRMVTIMDIYGVRVPFYLSTGKGGKTDVAAGKWYPFFGLGTDGWFNKTSGTEINSYYGSPELRAAAELLNQTIGDIRNDKTIPRTKRTGQHIDAINQGLNPTDNATKDTRTNLDKNIKDVLARIAAAQTTAAPAVPGSSPAAAPGDAVSAVEAQPATRARRQDDLATSLQNRDRSRASYQIQMNEIAAKPDYNRVSVSRDANTGAPMVFGEAGIPDSQKGRTDTVTMSDGKGGTRAIPVQYAVVSAGSVQASHNARGERNSVYGTEGLTALNNGRTAGLQEAWRRGTANAYVEAMQADAESHGVSPEAIAAIQNPMLIRLFDRSALEGIDNPGAASNVPLSANLSESEQAFTDARALSPSALASYRPLEVNAAGNRDFVRLASRDLGASTDLFQADGSLSARGRKRIESALLARAFPEPDIISDLTEATDDHLKSLGGVLLDIAGEWSQLVDAARAGQIDASFDITEHVIEAVRMVRRSRQGGTTIAELLGQGDMLSGNTHPLTESVVRLFYHNLKRIRAREKIAADLLEYARTAMTNVAGMGDMFGDRPTPIQTLETIRGRAEQGEAQPGKEGLFGGRSKSPRADTGTLRPAGDRQESDRGRAETAGDGQGEVATQAPTAPEPSRPTQGQRSEPANLSDLSTEALRTKIRAQARLGRLEAHPDAQAMLAEMELRIGADAMEGFNQELDALETPRTERLNAQLLDGDISVAEYLRKRKIDPDGFLRDPNLRLRAAERTEYGRLIQEIRQTLEGYKDSANKRMQLDILNTIEREFAHPFRNDYATRLQPGLKVRFGRRADGVPVGNEAKRAHREAEDALNAEDVIRYANEAQTQETAPAEAPQFSPNDTAYLFVEATQQWEPVNYRGPQGEGQAVVVRNGQQWTVPMDSLRAEKPAERVTRQQFEDAIDRGELEQASEILQTLKQQHRDNLLASNDGEITGIEGKHESRDGWAVILPEMSSEDGTARIQYYDENGFSGHSVYATPEKALDDLVTMGYTTPDKGAMSRMQGTDAWNKGMEAAERVRQFSSGQISMEEFAGANASAQETARTPEVSIEDFGEHIAGARKDYAAAYKDRMDAAQELDIASEPLSKVWPDPDYAKLLEEGADPYVVAFVHAARDEIPVKPRQSWKLKRWVASVQALRDVSSQLLNGEITRDKLKGALGDSRTLQSVSDRVELYEAIGHDQPLKGVRISEGRYSLIDGVKHDPPRVIWSVEKSAKATAFGNWPQQIAQGATRAEAIADFKKKVRSGQAEINKTASKQVSFDIYSYRRGEKAGKWFIGKKIGKEYVDLESFDNSKDARAYLDSHHDDLVAKLEKMKEIPAHRKESNAPRVGADHRNGADVTPEQFQEAFGFYGVQFGNWVEGSRRQQDLNRAYDALMDLAGVLNLPPRALSLNGELGLAFGARGTGGIDAAAAHYEPGQIVINLTKKSGAGSLAHEWFHGVDNYFGRDRAKGRKPNERFSTLHGPDPSARLEMAAAFKGIVQAINSTALKERSVRLDRTRAKPYWSTGHEMAARAFESYIIEKLRDQGASNDYLANIVSAEYWEAAAKLGLEKDGTFPYPEAAEIPAIRAAFDEFFRTVEVGEADAAGNIPLYSRTPLGFYSVLEQAIAQAPKKLDGAKPGAWKMWINSNAAKLGVKSEEIRWSGILDWLDLRDGPVSTADISAYLEQGGVQVEEVVLSGEHEIPGYAIEEIATAWGDGFAVVDDDGGVVESFETEAEAKAWIDSQPDTAVPTKFSTYTIPGGENYREVLLTLPAKTSATADRAEYEAWAERNHLLPNATRTEQRYERETGRPAPPPRTMTEMNRDKADNYQSPHWDQPNVLAHLRVDDRTGPNGEKRLFVQEFQSDWGQEGRKKGFVDKEVSREELIDQYDDLNAERSRLEGLVRDADDADPATQQLVDRLSEVNREMLRIDDAMSVERSGVPAAPYVTDTQAWTSLVLKRVLVMAVEGGYDQVVFVTGEQAAELYSLDKRLKEIEYRKVEEDQYDISVTDINGNFIEEASGVYSAKKLADVVGKDIAQRIVDGDGVQVDGPSLPEWFSMEGDKAQSMALRGEDLKIEAKGMRKYYDGIVPLVGNKILKPFGVRIETVDMGSPKSREQTLENRIRQQTGETPVSVDSMLQPGITITPEMRQQIKEKGLTLFSKDNAAVPRESLTTRAVRNALRPVTDTLRTPTEVHATPEAASEATNLDIPPDANGFYWRGRMHLIASAHDTVDQAEGTLWHEITHAGVAEIFGSDVAGYRSAMTRISMHNANIRKAAAEWNRQYGADMLKDLRKRKIIGPRAQEAVRLRAIEEALADLSKAHGKDIRLKGLRQFINDIVQWMRARGFQKLPDLLERLTDAEALGMIVAAREAVTVGEATVFTGAETAKFSFAGERAETADTDSLEKAKSDLAAGKDPEAVRQETGWSQGDEGMWRFEIDDSQATLKADGKTFNEVMDALSGDWVRNPTLADVLDHPRLFEAYPALRDVIVRGNPPDEGTPRGWITKSAAGYPVAFIRSDLSKEQALSTLLHEVQHEIQHTEGFATGGLADGNYGRYKNLAGEVESRNTQTRLKMTAEERRRISPEATRDVPREQVIIVWNGEEMASLPGPAAATPQTETKAFKDWFGDSQVVDESGQPLVVYHGTFSDFSVFDAKRSGENTDGNASSEAYAQTARVGFWFSTKPMGSSSAGYAADMPVYLAIKNPKREFSLDWLAQGLERMTGQEYQNQLIEEGYDGIVLEDEEFGGTSYIAFRPEQIKSAIGNRGTFDPANPDIRFSRAQPVGAPAAGPTIESHAENILKLRAVWDSASDVVRRAKMTDVADAIDNYYDGWDAWRGKVLGSDQMMDAQDALRKLGRKERKEALDLFRKYQAANNNGRPQEAQQIRGSNPVVAQLIDATEWMYDFTGTVNQQVGVEVYDPQIDGWRPIGKIPAPRMFSRMLLPEVNEVLRGDGPRSNPELWNRMVDALIADGHVADATEAWKYVTDYYSEFTRNDYFAGVEKARARPLPEMFYDYSFDAMLGYADRWSQRISQIEQFGQKKGMGSPDLLEQAIKKAGDQRTRDYLSAIRNTVFQVRPHQPMDGFLANTNMLATMLQLANPFTASRNLGTGLIYNWADYGSVPSAKALIEIAKDARKAYREMTHLGVLKDDLLAIQQDMVAQGASQKLAKGTSTAMRIGLYTLTERFIRVHAAMTGKYFLADALHHWNRNPHSRKSKQYYAWFQRHHLDIGKLKAESGVGEETAKWLRLASNIPQGSYKVNMVPLFTDTPFGRFIWKYQKYGTQRTREFVQNHLKPFVAGEKVEYKDSQGNTHVGHVRNFQSLLRWSVAPMLFGTALAQALQAIFGAPDPGPDLDELEKALENKDHRMLLGLILSRWWHSSTTLGALGFFQMPIQAAMDIADRQRMKSPLDPPGLAPIKGVLELLMQGYDQGTLTLRDIDLALTRNISLYRATKRGALTGVISMSDLTSETADRLMVVRAAQREATLEQARRDRQYVRRLTRRFASEEDLKGKRRALGVTSKTPMSPISQKVIEELLLGNPESARAIVRLEMEKAGSNHDADAIATSIMSSVRSFDPGRISTAPSEYERARFLSWAKGRVSDQNYQKVLRVTGDYRNAAIAAGLAGEEWADWKVEIEEIKREVNESLPRELLINRRLGYQ